MAMSLKLGLGITRAAIIGGAANEPAGTGLSFWLDAHTDYLTLGTPPDVTVWTPRYTAFSGQAFLNEGAEAVTTLPHAATYDGMPALEFIQANDTGLVAPWGGAYRADWLAATTRHVFVVFNAEGQGEAQEGTLYGNPRSASASNYGGGLACGDLVDGASYTDRLFGYWVFNSTAVHLKGTTSPKGSGWQIGELQVTDGANELDLNRGEEDTSAGTPVNNYGVYLCVGSQRDGGVAPKYTKSFDGHIAEILDYDDVLSAADRATTLAYLGNKYGVALS